MYYVRCRAPNLLIRSSSSSSFRNWNSACSASKRFLATRISSILVCLHSDLAYWRACPLFTGNLARDWGLMKSRIQLTCMGWEGVAAAKWDVLSCTGRAALYGQEGRMDSWGSDFHSTYSLEIYSAAPTFALLARRPEQ